jgi:hypothetical protein
MKPSVTSINGSLRAYVPDADLTALLVVNAVPIVGLLAFDLSALGLLAVYWLEFGILCFWAVVRATFAGRPMERTGDPLLLGALSAKRATMSVPGTDASIRLMTIPTLLFVIPILVGIWVFVGALVVGPVASVTPDTSTSPWLVVGALGIFLAEGRRTITTYFQTGTYREHNVATALRSVVTEGTTVLLASVLALFVAFIAVSSGGGGASPRALERAATGPLIAVVVSVRLLTDLTEQYYDGRLLGGLRTLLGRDEVYNPPECKSVDASLSGTPDVLRPPLSGRLLPTASHILNHPGPWLITPVAVFAAALAAFVGTTRIAFWMLLVGVGGPTVLVCLDYWIRYAGVAYRTDGTAIVATDRLFQTNLWRREPPDVDEVRVTRDTADEWLGTSTVSINCDERPIQLPRLRDPDPVVEVLASAHCIDTPDTAVSRRTTTTEPAATTQVGRALLRLDETVGESQSLVAVSLLALAGVIALVVAAQFGGGVAAAMFVLVFTTLPLVAVIMYYVSE